MKCAICTRVDAKEVNVLLLQRNGRRAGVMQALAQKLGVSRQSLWRHRKDHLKLQMSRKPPKTEGLTFQERAKALGQEADRLQCQAENGAPKELIDQAMRALALRIKLLSMEAALSRRDITPKNLEGALKEAAAEPEELEPAEQARIEKEFAEVVGNE